MNSVLIFYRKKEKGNSEESGILYVTSSTKSTKELRFEMSCEDRAGLERKWNWQREQHKHREASRKVASSELWQKELRLRTARGMMDPWDVFKKEFTIFEHVRHSHGTRQKKFQKCGQWNKSLALSSAFHVPSSLHSWPRQSLLPVSYKSFGRYIPQIQINIHRCFWIIIDVFVKMGLDHR